MRPRCSYPAVRHALIGLHGPVAKPRFLIPPFSTPMPPTEQTQWFLAEVHPYEPALRAYLLKRFPSVQDHDDLVQQTYSRTLRARECGCLTHPKAFMFTTARNAAIDLIRRRSVTPLDPFVDDIAVPVLDELRNARESLERQEEMEALIEAVLGIPERCRAVVLLRFFDGLTVGQIAERLGIAPGTVRVQMFKGVQHCIAFFAQRGMLDAAAGNLK